MREHFNNLDDFILHQYFAGNNTNHGNWLAWCQSSNAHSIIHANFHKNAHEHFQQLKDLSNTEHALINRINEEEADIDAFRQRVQNNPARIHQNEQDFYKEQRESLTANEKRLAALQQKKNQHIGYINKEMHGLTQKLQKEDIKIELRLGKESLDHLGTLLENIQKTLRKGYNQETGYQLKKSVEKKQKHKERKSKYHHKYNNQKEKPAILDGAKAGAGLALGLGTLTILGAVTIALTIATFGAFGIGAATFTSVFAATSVATAPFVLKFIAFTALMTLNALITLPIIGSGIGKITNMVKKQQYKSKMKTCDTDITNEHNTQVKLENEKTQLPDILTLPIDVNNQSSADISSTIHQLNHQFRTLLCNNNNGNPHAKDGTNQTVADTVHKQIQQARAQLNKQTANGAPLIDFYQENQELLDPLRQRATTPPVAAAPAAIAPAAAAPAAALAH